jgi:hypothetical protein
MVAGTSERGGLRMSGTDPTGYGESDTTDGPVGTDQDGGSSGDPAPGAADGGGVTLTTDAEAQDDDSVLRPGNAPD